MPGKIRLTMAPRVPGEYYCHRCNRRVLQRSRRALACPRCGPEAPLGATPWKRHAERVQVHVKAWQAAAAAGWLLALLEFLIRAGER